MAIGLASTLALDRAKTIYFLLFQAIRSHVNLHHNTQRVDYFLYSHTTISILWSFIDIWECES